jgi:hypothetical protein
MRQKFSVHSITYVYERPEVICINLKFRKISSFVFVLFFVFVSKLGFERFWKKDKLLKEKIPNFCLCFVSKYFQEGSDFLTKSQTPL